MPDHRRPVVWSPEARADLSHIWDYYAGVAGPQTADNIVRDIERACRVLEDHAYAGRARDEVRPGLRSIAARPFVVFYRAGKDATEIARVLDGRRDLDEEFSDTPETP